MEMTDYGPEYIRPVEGFPFYYVTVLGEVFSCNPRSALFKKSGPWRLLSGSWQKGNYRRVGLAKECGIHKRLLIHRLVAIAFIPNPENKTEVNHIDSDRTNNNLENLEWCTPLENSRHAYKMGFGTVGERASKAKMKEEDVLEIRRLYESGLCGSITLGKKYSLHRNTIRKIVRRKTWKHI